MGRTRTCLLTVGAAAAVILAGAVPAAATEPATVVPAAAVAPASAACGATPPRDKDGRSYLAATQQLGLFSGSSADCARLATVSPGDTLDYYCYTTNPGGTWTYLRDASQGRAGWGRDAYLPANGSTVPC